MSKCRKVEEVVVGLRGWNVKKLVLPQLGLASHVQTLNALREQAERPAVSPLRINRSRKSRQA